MIHPLNSTALTLGLVFTVSAFALPFSASAKPNRTFTFTTRDGMVFEDATFSRRTPDGVSFFIEDGVRKVRFDRLPDKLQEHFRYDPDEMDAYVAHRRAAQAEQRRFLRKVALDRRAKALRRKLLPKLDTTVSGTVSQIKENGVLLRGAKATQPVPIYERRKILSDGPTTLNPKRPRTYRAIYVPVTKHVPLDIGSTTIFLESQKLAREASTGEPISVLAYEAGEHGKAGRSVPRFTTDEEVAIAHVEEQVAEAWENVRANRVQTEGG